jgi:hypothetical protein
MKLIKLKDKTELLFRTGLQGIGFEVIHRVEKEDKIERNQIFFTYDKEKWKALAEEVEKTKEIPEWPSTKNEIPDTKILVLRSKHYIGYYDASTHQKLENAIRFILKNEKDYYYSPGTPPENDIKNVEEIEQIPERFPNLRKEAKESFEKYQKRLKEFEAATKNWNKLHEIIDGKGTLVEAIRVLEHYESGHYEIEDLQTIEKI